MDQRVNMIMVGARDIPLLRAFYEQGLGWTVWGEASNHVAMYKLGTAVLVFLDADYLASESGLPAVAQPKSLWAIFVSDKREVEALIDQAVRAGARVTSPVRDRDLGLYSGYFTDPEDNGWEVVWSPHMPLSADGALTLPQG